MLCFNAQPINLILIRMFNMFSYWRCGCIIIRFWFIFYLSSYFYKVRRCFVIISLFRFQWLGFFYFYLTFDIFIHMMWRNVHRELVKMMLPKAYRRSNWSTFSLATSVGVVSLFEWFKIFRVFRSYNLNSSCASVNIQNRVQSAFTGESYSMWVSNRVFVIWVKTTIFPYIWVIIDKGEMSCLSSSTYTFHS